MHKRIDEPQRRLNPSENFPQVAPPSGGSRFAELGEAALQSGMAFPIPGYQLNQTGTHHGPVPPLGHHGVSLSAAGPVPISRGPPQSLHTQTVPQHPANQPLSGGQQQQQQQQQFQRLKVEDALSYLDQVKLQFGNQPQVYNDFLDIMKEFKSQTIDTPGVINRVSNLFKGHPDLIVGFNTFLPPGYKIEVQCEVINVHQPGQQVMSIAALAQSQAVANSNRQQKQGMAIWEQALASQTSNKVAGPLSHSSLPTTSPADHRSYHQSPRHDTAALTSAVAAATAQQQQQQQQQAAQHPPPPHTQSQPPSQQPPQPPPSQQSQQQQQAQQGQGQSGQPGQPVEFNHAINYVNKIKNRFQGQPDIYKQFLEILHTYQKEQRLTRDGLVVGGPAKPLTESEVYQQVANLFKHQEDLLAEFGQFLPDATGASSYSVASFADSALGVRNDHSSTVKKPGGYSSSKGQTGKSGSGVKRPSTNSGSSVSSFPPPSKKKGVPKDLSLSDASKTGSLTEYAFFDKVRKALRHQEVYDNFLRSIILFNQDIVTKSELITLAGFFLSKFPDLYREFKDLLGLNEQGGGIEPVPHNAAATKERLTGDLAMEIDFNTCKRYGASYRGVPSKYIPPKCSGRTPLCKEVLNDTWVSFPTWSEDSSFVTSRKTQYEENIYKCEDERFELDYVIESNYTTIKSLEAVLKKMNRMTQDEGAKHKLDNSLGGSSDSINRNSIHRIYGDKAYDIIDGLKKNPVVAVPLVLRRLKAKDEEWREAQKQFNKLWKEQNEKFYLKSLDHQGANFKQHDIKAIRGKSLLNQIETVYDERADYEETVPQGPMLSFQYENRALMEDAAKLIIHHVKRQSGLDKETKCRIKQLIKQLVPDLFFAPRGELSDDDGDMNEDMDQDEEDSSLHSTGKHGEGLRSDRDRERERERGRDKTSNYMTESNAMSTKKDVKKEDVMSRRKTDEEKMEVKEEDEEDEEDKGDEDGKSPLNDDNDKYTLMICNTTWYIFLRLHHMMCSRLLKVYTLTQRLIEEHTLTKKERKESVALALRLRTPLEVDVEDYYSYFLDMVMSVLDGNLEGSQYEDTMREMYGIQAYQFFTMDKLVQNTVRQVQHLVIDEIPGRITKLYEEQVWKGGAGGRWATRHQRATLEQSYLRQAETILVDESPFRIVIHSRSGCLEVDMLDPPMDNPESVKDAAAWSSYITDYATSSSTPGLAASVLVGNNSNDGSVNSNNNSNNGTSMALASLAVKSLTSNAGILHKREEFIHRLASHKPIYLVRNKKRSEEWISFKAEHKSYVKMEEINGRAVESHMLYGDKDKDIKPDISGSCLKIDDSQNDNATIKEDMDERKEEEREKDVKTEFKHSPDSTSGDIKTDSHDDKDMDIGEDDEEEGTSGRRGTSVTSAVSTSHPSCREDEEEEDMERDSDDGGLGDDEDDEKDSSSVNKRKKHGSVSDGLSRRTFQSVDTTSVKFQPNSAANNVVSRSGRVFYNVIRAARTQASHKKVSQLKYHRLNNWHTKWLSQNVSTPQTEGCSRWMLGQWPDALPNRTTAVEVRRLEQTPFRCYFKYKVEWMDTQEGDVSSTS